MITNSLTITAYCACSICCGPSHSGITSSGLRPVQGITIAASRTIPFGTHCHIGQLTNDFIVQDRLSRRYDNRVDIYFQNHNDAKKFGIYHNVTVIFYDK